MKIIQGTQNIQLPIPYPVLALGNFDGVHLGHQAIFKKVVDKAKELGGTGIVLTLEPHPRKIFSTKKCAFLLTTFQQKIEQIEKTGIDLLICFDFTPDFAAQSPREFIERILVEKINVKEVFAGHDFNFGKGREGSLDFLKEMGEEFDFKVDVLAPIKINGHIVSSSFVRDLITKGEVKNAAHCLGRPYSLEGNVIGGSKRGTSMGFPTANINVKDNLIPHTGVYAVRLFVQKKKLDGVANVGHNPTFNKNQLGIEIHIFDFTENLYNKTIRFFFIEKIRDETAFSSEGELKAQIQKDIIIAKEILKKELY